MTQRVSIQVNLLEIKINGHALGLTSKREIMSSINADDYFAQLAKMLDEKKQKEYAEAEEAEKKIKAEYEEMLAKLKSSEKKDDHLENQYGETSSNSDFSDYFKTITDAHEHITRQKREDARRAVAEKKNYKKKKS